jgi:EAL domain-containing protein (putative c-di-GMP-specific phosphodiesterase class I)
MLSTQAAHADPPGLSPKDRLLAFAFAASDLLLEVTVDGRIAYAAGASKARFGLPPERLVGQNLVNLFAAADRPALNLALSTTALRGRLQPVIVRLSDPMATPMILSGLSLPSAPGRLCFTVGRLPALPGKDEPAAPGCFIHLAEERLHAGSGATLNLVEIAQWGRARSALPAEEQRALQAEIMEVLNRMGGPGSISGEIAAGRFGLVGESEPSLSSIATELEAVLGARPATAHAKVRSAQMPLERGGLTNLQAARALRFALSRFAEGGARATEDAGFNDGLASFITSAQGQARAVRSIITDGQFRLVFQPVVHLASRALHHYEALLRPLNPPGSMVQSTQDFVLFAEAFGLSEELDWAVLQHAVRAQREAPTAAIAVNMSGLSMQNRPFCERAAKLITAQTKPGNILVELTETAAIEDVAAAAASIELIRRTGTPVCLDDFGAGSAAFRYLRDFRVDYVKLDGAYVRGSLRNAREHGFLLSMIELANFVGAKVIAETIECEDEARMMHELGVEYGQGWLFGKPGALPGTLGIAWQSKAEAVAEALP